MRIVYIGVVEFSYICLKEVIKNNGNVVGVLTKKKSEYNADFCDLSKLATENNIPSKYFDNINDEEIVNWIKEKKPDIIFCFGLSQLIKGEILSIPPMGVIGCHDTLLPRNRGRHPIIWTLVLGLKETGQTFFVMDKEADSGLILSQKSLKIETNDNAKTLYNKINELACEQIRDFLPKLITNNYKLIKQDEILANSWRKRTREDGIIDWRMSTEAILNLIKALTNPYPGAEFKHKGKYVTVWNAEKIKSDEHYENVEPGKVVNVIEGYPIVKCYDGLIKLIKYEPCVILEEGEYLK